MRIALISMCSCVCAGASFAGGGDADDSVCDADQSGTVDFNDLVSALFVFGPC